MQIGVGGHNNKGKFNKPLNLFISSIQLREDFTHEASTSKKGHSTIEKKPLQVPSRERSLSMLTCPNEREEATATCIHFPCSKETINLSFL